MFCGTNGCGWNGELGPERTFERDGTTHCGLCSEPASEKVVRRDEEAEDQPELAAEAERDFEDIEDEAEPF